MRERLLDEDVLAQLDGGQGRHGVEMVRGPHGHGVDVLALLLEHDPEILVARDVRILGERPGRPLPVRVAQGDDVLLLHPGQVAAALAAAADPGDVEGVARGDIARPAENPARDDHHPGGRSRGSQERSPAHVCHAMLLFEWDPRSAKNERAVGE